MKVAILFWGLTRSLKYTHKSIKSNILNVLDLYNIDYDIYMHTYKVEDPYSNRRSREFGIKLNFDEHKLIKPKIFISDNLSDVVSEIDFNQYKKNVDPWNDGYKSQKNFILAMYSKKKITSLMEQNVNNSEVKKVSNTIDLDKIIQLDKEIEYFNTVIRHLNNKKNQFKNNKKKIDQANIKIKDLLNKIHKLKKSISELKNKKEETTENTEYDYCLFIRPDCNYLSKFKMEYFNMVNDKTVAIPNFCIYGNFNDRMCLTTYKNGLIYGKLFDKMLDYSIKRKLHSEEFHYHLIKKEYNITIKLIDFYFNRVRANGNEMKSDSRVNRVDKDQL